MAGTFEELDVALVCRETCIYDLLAGVKCQSPKWQTSLRALGVELSSPGLDPASLLIGSFHGVLSVVHKLCWADADRGCKPLEAHKQPGPAPDFSSHNGHFQPFEIQAAKLCPTEKNSPSSSHKTQPIPGHPGKPPPTQETLYKADLLLRSLPESPPEQRQPPL